MPHTNGETQYRLLIQQSIENPRRAKLALQALRNAIHAAFFGNVFTEQSDIGITQHQVSQRKVDALSQRHRLRQIARVLCEHCIASFDIRQRRRQFSSYYWLDRRHDVSDRF